jgi:hypothetical protein
MAFQSQLKFLTKDIQITNGLSYLKNMFINWGAAMRVFLNTLLIDFKLDKN